MGKSVERFFERPIYTYLFVLAFFVWKSVQCVPNIKPLFLLGVLAVSFLLIFIGQWISGKIKFIPRPHFFVLIVVANVLFFDALYTFTQHALGINFHIRIFFVATVLIAVALSNLRNIFPKSTDTKLNLFFNYALLILCVVTISNGWLTGIREEKYVKDKKKSFGAQLTVMDKKPDIVWILLDEYASSASLNQYFGFKNPLDTFLRNRDFVVLDSIKSRFTETIYSVGSLFNMDDSVAPPNYVYAGYRLSDNIWVNQLKENGYSFTSYDFMDIGGVKRLKEVYIFPTDYNQQIFSGTLIKFMVMAQKSTPDVIDQYNNQVISLTNEALGDSSEGPKFLWCHLLLPHLPFFRDRNGKLFAHPMGDYMNVDQVKKQYIEYLSYGNSIVEKLLSDHPSFRNKIVVISGDHGARYPFIPDRAEYKRPYGAIYLPSHSTSTDSLQYIQQISGYIMNQLVPAKR